MKVVMSNPMNITDNVLNVFNEFNMIISVVSNESDYLTVVKNVFNLNLRYFEYFYDNSIKESTFISFTLKSDLANIIMYFEK